MKRKIKRLGKKKWLAYLTPLGAIVTFCALLFNFMKDPIIAVTDPLIKSLFSLDEKSKLALPILYSIFLAIILLVSYIISRLYLSYSKPNKKYFNAIDFEKPTDATITKAVEGILNSEKTRPYFVHAAPVNNEIEQLYQALNKKGFVWESGKPGDGKTMLAYNALYRYRKRFGIANRFIHRSYFRLKYKIYSLDINKISDETEIDQILDELDDLKGNKRKIILVDDAHLLSFEDKLRYEFEEEAKEKLNGKFIWINTNYLETTKSINSNSINIEFEIFYPKLIQEFYHSQNPIISEIIKNKCTGLDEAIKQKGKCRINDPWHFNFIATNGEQRIIQLLYKLSSNNEEQEILLLSIFLFSVRNVITGEKEINQTEFSNLLTNIDIPYFKNIIEIYKPNKIITDLASQDKGRFLIIENKNILDRGFLKAPHYRLSIAIIKSITNQFSQNLIVQMIDASKVFLTTDFTECRYFATYFNALGKYQKYFLVENKDWVKLFLTLVNIEQLDAYSSLLNFLRKSHYVFFKELITDEYLNIIASKISLIDSKRLDSAQRLIRALGDERKKLIEKFNWQELADNINRAEIAQFTQVAYFIISLADTKDDLIKKLDWRIFTDKINKIKIDQFEQVGHFINALKEYRKDIIEKFDWKTIAQITNKADIIELKHIGNFINALGKNRLNFIEKLDWDKLVQTINTSDAARLAGVSEFICALEDKRKKLIEKFNWLKLADIINKAEITQFTQVANFINSLEDAKDNLIEMLDWKKFAQISSNAEIAQFAQVAQLIDALENKRTKLIDNENFNFATLAQTANTADMSQIQQLSDFINALGDAKDNLIEMLDWKKFAQISSNAEIAQFAKVAQLINALGDDRKKLSVWINIEMIINFSKTINKDQIASLCIIIASIEEEKQYGLIIEVDWVSLLNKITINHSIQIRYLTYVLSWQNKKYKIINSTTEQEDVMVYLTKNIDNIIRFATQYFIVPDDFQTSANLLVALFPYSPEISNKIIEELAYKIKRHFNISPKYYQAFSNLLNAIHQINSESSISIIMNSFIWGILYNSFQSKDVKDQINGFQNLLQSINTIDPTKYNEIIVSTLLKQIYLKVLT